MILVSSVISVVFADHSAIATSRSTGSRLRGCIPKSLAVKETVPGLWQKMREMNGEKQIPRITTITVQKEMRVKVAFRKSCVSFLFSFESPLEMYSLKVGIKATETLFSAKRRRRRFGIMKAVVKASAYMEVPRKAAFVISRTRPMILERKVRAESEIPDFMSFLLLCGLFSVDCSDIDSVYLTQ